jgi:hypothetical protein
MQEEISNTKPHKDTHYVVTDGKLFNNTVAEIMSMI